MSLHKEYEDTKRGWILLSPYIKLVILFCIGITTIYFMNGHITFVILFPINGVVG